MNSSNSSSQFSVGEKIRYARESFGLDRARLAAKTGLHEEIIEALETDAPSGISSPPYMRASLVTLCKALNLNKDEIIAQYNGEDQETQKPLSAPEESEGLSSRITAKKNMPLLFISVTGILLILLIAKLSQETESPIAEPTLPPEEDSLPAITELESPEEEPEQVGDTTFQEGGETQAASPISDSVPKVDSASQAVEENTQSTNPANDSLESAGLVSQKTPSVDSLPRELTPAKIPFSSKLVVFRCVTDSIWLHVKRNERKEVNKLLFKGELWKVALTDSFYTTIGIPNGVEVHYQGKAHTAARSFSIIQGTLFP